MKTKLAVFASILFRWFAGSALIITFTFSIFGCSHSSQPTQPASGLLDSYFDSTTSNPVASNITYTRKDGATSTEIAIPGQITILSNFDANSDSVAKVIILEGGDVLAQAPAVGFYLAGIDSTRTSAFLSSMYSSNLVLDAFPNEVGIGRSNYGNHNNIILAVTNDANALVQTIDVSANIGCSKYHTDSNVWHEDGVGSIAGQNGVDVRINDVTIPITAHSIHASATGWSMIHELLSLIAARKNGPPLIINFSMGSDPDNLANDYHWYDHFVSAVLSGVVKRDPQALNNVVIFVSGSDMNLDETSSFNNLHDIYPNSPIWKSLYFVGSSNNGSGCNLGFAAVGTPNTLSAPGCNLSIPNAPCPGNGNSFSTPAIANLVGQTFLASGSTLNLQVIAQTLWQYQTNNNGQLPSPTLLLALCGGGNTGGGGNGSNQFDGTYSGSQTGNWTCPL